MNFLCKLTDLKKNYFLQKVLRGIDLELSAGKFYGLLGENGAGKSTLFRLMVGLERITQGEGKLFGHPIQSLPPEFKRDIGIVSEQIELETPLTMDKFFHFYKGHFPRWNNELFELIIENQKMNLSKQFENYSRGQKMQLILTAELCKTPQIILLDEITSVLDVYSRKFYLKLLKDYQQKGGTVFITSNVISEVEKFLDHVIIIKDGLIAFNGKKSLITENPCPITNDSLTVEEYFTVLHHPENSQRREKYDQAA